MRRSHHRPPQTNTTRAAETGHTIIILLERNKPPLILQDRFNTIETKIHTRPHYMKITTWDAHKGARSFRSQLKHDSLIIESWTVCGQSRQPIETQPPQHKNNSNRFATHDPWAVDRMDDVDANPHSQHKNNRNISTFFETQENLHKRKGQRVGHWSSSAQGSPKQTHTHIQTMLNTKVWIL